MQKELTLLILANLFNYVGYINAQNIHMHTFLQVQCDDALLPPPPRTHSLNLVLWQYRHALQFHVDENSSGTFHPDRL